MFDRKRTFKIDRLGSGGVITNYHCTSACGHCLYACSPKRPRDYIDGKNLIGNLEKIKTLGCRSIHVGGGEPFLNPEGLQKAIETIRAFGMRVDYVETNSSWFKDRGSACRLLTALKDGGLSTLLVSISPFHNEHIPFRNVKGVISACREAGIRVFPWISDFFSEIDAFDDRLTHPMAEYEKMYGGRYVRNIPSRYWIHFGGRALRTFSSVFGGKTCSEILQTDRRGCEELLDVGHFHLDLYGLYIPGLCSGLAIHRDDLGKPLASDKYPLLHLLFHQGVGGLYAFVRDEFAFHASGRYLSKCHLCLELRRHLVLNTTREFKELAPRDFYDHV